MIEEYRNNIIASACLLGERDLRWLCHVANKRCLRTDFEGGMDFIEVLAEVENLCLPTRERMDERSKMIRRAGRAMMDAMDGNRTGEDGSRKSNVSSFLECMVSDADTQEGGFRNGNDGTK